MLWTAMHLSAVGGSGSSGHCTPATRQCRSSHTQSLRAVAVVDNAHTHKRSQLAVSAPRGARTWRPGGVPGGCTFPQPRTTSALSLSPEPKEACIHQSTHEPVALTSKISRPKISLGINDQPALGNLKLPKQLACAALRTRMTLISLVARPHLPLQYTELTLSLVLAATPEERQDCYFITGSLHLRLPLPLSQRSLPGGGGPVADKMTGQDGQAPQWLWLDFMNWFSDLYNRFRSSQHNSTAQEEEDLRWAFRSLARTELKQLASK